VAADPKLALPLDLAAAGTSAQERQG